MLYEEKFTKEEAEEYLTGYRLMMDIGRVSELTRDINRYKDELDQINYRIKTAQTTLKKEEQNAERNVGV